MPHAPSGGGGPALRRELARFALVGIIATCTHYLVALSAAAWIDVYVANLLGYLAAVAVSYFGHQRFSFRLTADRIHHRRQFPRFLLGSLGGLLLGYLVLAVLKDGLGAPDWLSLAAAVCLVPLYTYLVNRLCVFRIPVE